MELRNQVAVVTGGARGTGRATAQLLAQRGAAVCVNYALHAEAAEAVVAEIVTAGGRAIAVAADVANSAAVEAMVARAEALNGEGWAISQVADRIDGKATAEIQTEQMHRYVIEAPAQLDVLAETGGSAPDRTIMC